MSEHRQTNVDNEGNVLYLDQALLDRKEVGFPPYKNRPDGLGIYNWILKNILYMSKKRWPLALRLYHLFVKYSVWMKKGGWKARLYKEAARIVVEHQLGRRFSCEEACARVDEAAAAGLMGQAVWIEVEQMLWGVPNDLMDRFLEICFCCPCCCITMKLARNATEKERHRFHPSGWTAVANTTKCAGCGDCLRGPNGCPVEALSLDENNRIHIDQERCVGCGICRSRCQHDVISIKQTMPMRKDLHEYFLKEYNLDIKLGNQ